MKSFTEHKTLVSLLIAVFLVNQIAIASVSQAMGATRGILAGIFGISTASAMEIMMPIPNEDGKTTRLQMMPTITEVSGEPESGDTVANAMTVMMATGKPFYAPGAISFDDPIGSLKAWGQYETAELDSTMIERYKRLVSIFPCNFCCGSPTSVTLNGNCGCAHARAARGFFRYLLSEYGDAYSDDQLYGEAYRWQAIWYPSGVVEDYLLATGRGDVLGHKTHGGAGEDGRHGINL
ncbi:TPA: hypothetical protein DDZ10_02125 [Candidatus Uhrbacteria bacterium]|uniref:Uncharacterized protein n=1 Tax=Candidatus Uhrbacteria bacterium GW2011_GWC2_53_7 TaxID=1618986 RepID=A0A0G1Y191_9BACT|nr:MAG: hypothetical protein UY79_C0003G0068 [Parcubacteria group bacterium GW2011_GWA2_53_21]KKW37001.1 MAG: hypothetical protein UY82_C0005G0011 [Candidatus Uhrbacteria bacterium GW2011_GWC2_53_7]HBL39446.1 hypothetical protein [Candidatus Uhrbacteria bacterium]